MTPRERIVRLEGLLERIARNVARPRTRRVVAVPAAAAAPAPAPVAAAPVAAAPAVVPAPPKPSAPDSAPAVVEVPAVESAAIGRASDVPPPSSVPTAPPAAPASPLASTPPFESLVPAAEAPPVAAAPPVASPSVSSVPPWKPEPGSSIQARPSSTMPPEELSDDDLVEVTTVPPPNVVAPAIEAASEVEVEIEEPPASSSRSKVAESLDQAIASAAADLENEGPIHTPPPESGPQEAVLPPGIEAPRAPEFAELATDLVRPASLGPTTEQLGETIELEGSDGPEIEIEVAGVGGPEPEPERPVEELEVALPRAEMPSGTYDVSVSMPASPVVHSAMPTMPAQQDLTPDVTARPNVSDADVMRVVRVTGVAPDTFTELLDASLGL